MNHRGVSWLEGPTVFATHMVLVSVRSRLKNVKPVSGQASSPKTPQAMKETRKHRISQRVARGTESASMVAGPTASALLLAPGSARQLSLDLSFSRDPRA